jgi:uncharacterized alpha-E superfamily protein
VISRVADHCFWFGRYLERTESTARVLSVTNLLALDAELSPRQCWQPVVIVSGIEPQFLEKFGEAAYDDGQRVQEHMTWDEGNLSSIRRSVSAARENARSIREVVSVEVWEATNELHLWIGTAGARAEYKDDRLGFYKRIRRSAQLCLGLVQSTMLQDDAFDFINLGATLESVGQTARLLDVQYHALTGARSTPIEAGVIDANATQVVETALWLSLLRACSGFEPFLKRHQGKVSGQVVASFLIHEPRFPRSIRHCVRAACEGLLRIRPPGETALPGGKTLERARSLDQWLEGREVEPFDHGEIHDLLTHVVDETAAICNDIGRDFLGYAEAVQSQSQSQ